MFKDDMNRIVAMIKNGELEEGSDESGAGGFWDLSYEIYGKDMVDNDDEQEIVEGIYGALWDLAETLLDIDNES